MATPLSGEELHRYTQLIDGILATADLETVTRKKVRKSLEKALGGKDLSDQKIAIKDLIEARFDAINSDDSPTSHDVKDEADDEIKVSTSQRRARSDDDDGGDGDDRQPAKKHKRASASIEDADARLAAELQAQENRLARARTTRGASTSKPVKRGNTKKKSAAKVKDDGSDSEGGGARSGSPGAQKEKRKAGGGFQKPYNLSPPLAELLGVPQVSRMQVVKLLWVHIKAHQLQDPTDKRQILCDDLMQAVFKQPKIDMFQMNKQLGHHLYPVEEE